MTKNINETTLSMDWNEAFSSAGETTDGAAAVSSVDALVKSIANYGCVNLDYISTLTGLGLDEAIASLKGLIYQNPETWNNEPYEGWETREEYISGNLRRKYKIAAREADQYPHFAENMTALETVMPEALKTDDIYVTLGSPWVPTHIIDEFMKFLFEEDDKSLAWFFRSYSQFDEEKYHVIHDEYGWKVPRKARYGNNPRVYHVFGTHRLNALEILEMTLNSRLANVYDEVQDSEGKWHRVFNQDETLLAIEKQKDLVAEFQDWVWKDEKRREELTDIFETRYASAKRRYFDGSYLTFPGMSEKASLYPYQKNAVSRILLTPNTLLCHEVGSGKTYTMIAAAMELRRMGLSQKNLFVVPNNIVGQWHDIFMDLYPDAKVLCIDPKAFVKSKRNAVLESIRDDDYDGIIMAYSSFDMIPISQGYYRKRLEAEIDKLRQLIAQKKPTSVSVKQKLKTVKKKLAKLQAEADKTRQLVCFDELGITRLFIDEAHNYKNVPVETHSDRIQGLNPDGSKKCQIMMDKVRFVQKNNKGGGVVMATGTPITNSITDIFVMQQYLQSGELALKDLQTFDSWIGMFAEPSTQFEIDIDTNTYKLATRYSKFHNLPELTAMISTIADFHDIDETVGLPECDGYEDISVPKSAKFTEFLHEISERADDVRSRRVKRTEDNLLKITTDARKAALDMRLFDDTVRVNGQTKVSACADKVYEIYCATKDEHYTQAVFCDISVPKVAFNIYDELKKLLLQKGIPSDEIAFVHDAETTAKRTALFDKVRSGKVRVIIGSTPKMGTGVNIQDKLVAIHHLDVPWRPSDMTQREGRIIRPDNSCGKVAIYRYYTTGSFDSYSWQLIETKQRFIDDLLSGTTVERNAEDVSDTVLSYAEIKANCVGNPLLKKRCEIANELSICRRTQRKQAEANQNLEQRLQMVKRLLENQGTYNAVIFKDYDHYRLAMDAEKQSLHTVKGGRKARQKERKQLRERLTILVNDNILRSRDSEAFEYKGFTVILPANMTEEEPFVWLQGEDRYKVSLMATEQGDYLDCIDRYLMGMGKHVDMLKRQMAEKRAEIRRIEDALTVEDDTADRINELKMMLESIDKVLEGKKNGKR